MRSMVKKQPTQQQSFTGLAGGQLQAFGSNNQYGMMGPNVMGNAMAGHQFPQHAPRQMYPPYNQGGDNMMNSNSMGLGGPSSLFMSNQFPRSNMGMTSADPNQFSRGSMGMTSTDMFEAGLRLERIEQRQQQRQMQMMDMLNNSNAPIAPSFNPQAGATTRTNFLNTNHRGDMSEVDLASEIMKQGEPGMEPWRALELAKRFKNE